MIDLICIVIIATLVGMAAHFQATETLNQKLAYQCLTKGQIELGPDTFNCTLTKP